ncbi:Ger(x)C family spore germination protein [Paenibacillus harenae]|uniref:Spore germination protein KC n=1 Tax=Paenibacillus harenae TaxID=306543 RepID=A0ABT9UD49_PAEHA|nr:Ger(x)C family spore germination protein [Paenibacillus harenae]MDQ0116139.1 spore germination protein KC [Paenibacillus harenae]
MINKLCLIICCLLLLLLLPGCWNRRELNELGIAVGIGIDKVGNKYRVTAQVVNPGEVAMKMGSNRSPVIIYEATGRTVFEALKKMTTNSPRAIYLSHLRILVFGEAMAKEGIQNPLDHFSRDHEVRTDFFIVVAKGNTAKNVLRVLTPLEKIPANSLFLSLDRSQKLWAPTATVTLDQLISDLISEGSNPVLTAIKVSGNGQSHDPENANDIDPRARLYYSGLAVFKADKLIGWLNEKESKGYNYLKDNVKNTVGVQSCPGGGNLSVEVFNTKTSTKGSVVNGKPSIDIRIEAEETIGEVMCQIDLSKTSTITMLEDQLEQNLKGILRQVIDKAQQEWKVDIFGLGEVIHRSNPQAWKSLKQNWNEQFTGMNITINAEVKIRRVGTVINSFKKKPEE